MNYHMGASKKIFCLLALLFPFCTPLLASENPLAIADSVEKLLSSIETKAIYEFTNTKIDGTSTHYKVRFEIKDPNHMWGYFELPKRDKGREILRINDDTWTFLPSAGRTIRVADRESFAGGDFSNSDVLRLDWSSRYSVILLKELTDQWIFEYIAKNSDAAYAKMRLWVDKKSTQPVQQIFYDSKGINLKRLRYGSVKKFSTALRPSRMVMENLITKQKSELIILSLESSNNMPESRFLVGNLGK